MELKVPFLRAWHFRLMGGYFTQRRTVVTLESCKTTRFSDRPFASLPDVYVNWEQGLLRITLDACTSNRITLCMPIIQQGE